MTVPMHVILQAADSLGRCHLLGKLAEWIAMSRLPLEWRTWSKMTSLPSHVGSVLVHQKQLREAQRMGVSVLERFPGARVLALGCGPSADYPVSRRGTIQAVSCESPAALWEVTQWMQPELKASELFSGSEVLPGIVGWSTAMMATAKKVPFIAQSDATCLLLGETGTGKELFARSLHYLSARAKSPFVPVNCGAVAEQLFENELFGHAQGAYTDARSKESGLLAFAEGGTLFLDEVDSLSGAAQVKLLRLLQEHEYRPVGSARTVKANVRIVAATNCDLRQMVAERRFREDLYHRLNVLRLTIPPLRERMDDIPLLANHFLQELVCRYPKKMAAARISISPCAMHRLLQYDWPGNVRELQGVMERAVLMQSSPVLDANSIDLPDVMEHRIAPPLSRLPQQPGMGAPRPVTLKAAKEMAILKFERDYLSELLESCAGNVSLAARMAGKERRSFQRLLKKHEFGSQGNASEPNA